MWEYIISAVIGIVIYQLISIIIYKCSKNNEKTMYILGTLVPSIIWNYCLWPIVSMFILSWCKANLNGYQFFYRVDDEVLQHDEVVYMTPSIAKLFCMDEDSNYFIKMVVEGKDIKELKVLNYMYKASSEFNFFDINVFKNTEE